MKCVVVTLYPFLLIFFLNSGMNGKEFTNSSGTFIWSTSMSWIYRSAFFKKVSTFDLNAGCSIMSWDVSSVGWAPAIVRKWSKNWKIAIASLLLFSHALVNNNASLRVLPNNSGEKPNLVYLPVDTDLRLKIVSHSFSVDPFLKNSWTLKPYSYT